MVNSVGVVNSGRIIIVMADHGKDSEVTMDAPMAVEITTNMAVVTVLIMTAFLQATMAEAEAYFLYHNTTSNSSMEK